MTVASDTSPAPEVRGKWMALLAAFLGWMFDGLEIGLFPLAARPAMVELLGPGTPQAPAPITQWIIVVPARWFTKEGNWRFLLLLGAMPAFLTFFIRLFVPESEKWKHAAANAPKARVRDIFAPGLSRLTILGACLAGVALLGTWGSVQQA